MKQIQFESREEWLLYRKGKIGGTGSSAILGEDSFNSPLKIWHQMTGRESDEIDDNPIMRKGRCLEPGIVDYLCVDIGAKRLDNPNIITVVEHTTNPRIYGSQDALIETGDTLPEIQFLGLSGIKPNTQYLVEAKDTMMFLLEPLKKWRIQANKYCGIYGMEQYIIVWQSAATKDINAMMYNFDQDLFDQTIIADEEMLELVDKDIAPPYTAVDDYVSYIDSIKDSSIETDEYAEKLLQGLIAVKKAEDGLKEQKEMLQLKTMEYMHDKEYLISAEQKVLTFKHGESNRFDSTKFKRDHPKTYKQYIKTTVTRSFRPNWNNLGAAKIKT